MSFIPSVEPWIGEDCAEAVKRQVLTGFLGPGNATKLFGERLAALAGVPYAVPTTSGTIALSVAAHATGLKPGDEIIVPAYGVISTINAFASIGLIPRLADIDPLTGCIDPGRLGERLTPKTKAVCYVNFSGHTGQPLVDVASICAAKGLPLIEDAACAFGHRYKGRAAGSFGTVGCQSFSVPKLLTTGQGGVMLTSDKKCADLAMAFIDHGDLDWRKTNTHHGIGTNLRFNDVSAALGLAQLDTMEQRLERKRKSYAALRDELGGNLYAVPGTEAPLHYIVFSDNPSGLVKALRAQEIGAIQQYRYLAAHPVFSHLDEPTFTGARYWERTAVYLPFGLALTEEDAHRIGQAIKASGIALLSHH